jgi:hypothetical protein
MSFPHASQFWWVLENRSDRLILDVRILGAQSRTTSHVSDATFSPTRRILSYGS